MLIGNTYRDAKKEASFFDDLFAHGVRRVIVISSLADESHLERAAGRGMTVVSYDRRATPGERSKVEHVTADNEAAARLATRCLVDAGHRRLAFATVAGMTVSRSDKIRGFRDGARGGRRRTRAGARRRSGERVRRRRDRRRALGVALAADPARPTGIVAVNDLFALGLMAGLRDGGLRVPDDVSVVGMDGHFLSAISNPALTTVQLPVTEMAEDMVRRVMRPDGDRPLAHEPHSPA